MLKKSLLGLCLGGLVFAAGAATVPQASVTPAVQAMVKHAIAAISPKAQVNAIDPSPLPGFYQVIADGQMLYVSADGKYLFNGDLLDLTRHKNLSDSAWAQFRKAQLAKLDPSQSIVFSPPHPKYTVTVFTDVNCGYCRALHQQIEGFNKAGIAVQYVAWPREGVDTTAGRPTPTYKEMSSVWCASDRKAALNAAMTGHAPKAMACANPVKQQFNLGLQLGVTGTPTIFGSDGRMLGGYVDADAAVAGPANRGLS